MGSGIMNITGDFTNNGTFNYGTGTVNFNGTTAQSINSSNSSIGFYNLTINKSLGDLTLNKTSEINSTLTFTQGLINSNASNLLVFNDNATATSHSATSYVIGPVRKVGNQAFTFPIGKSGKYAPAGISAPSLTTDHFTAEYFGTDPNSLYNRNSKESSINNVSACEYWLINQTNGTSSAHVTLSWNSSTRSCTINNINELLTLRWDGSMWRNHGNNISLISGTTASGTLTSSTIVSSFSPFTLGSSSTNNPLPVELTNFKTACQNQQVKLTWSTLSESNNDYFGVERSTDGMLFEEIGKVDGNGTSNQPHEYQFFDEQSLNGTSYYRLIQVDFNWQSETHPIIKANCDTDNNELNIYPNPNSGTFEIIGLSDDNLIEITDVLGKKILSFKSDSANEKINLADVKPGIYFVNLSDKFGKVLTKKIIIEN
jgi:hypothetical protein